jgi:hypothetical protein
MLAFALNIHLDRLREDEMAWVIEHRTHLIVYDSAWSEHQIVG